MTKSVMQFPGSLLSDNAHIVASWDIEQGKTYGQVMPLHHPSVLNAALSPIQVSYTEGMRLNLINAMGVTIGDSIVGLNVCHYLKYVCPEIHINLLRPETPLPAVDAIYHLARRTGVIDTFSCLPWPLAYGGDYDVNIDMGNQLYRDSFQSMEMHDYFYHSVGLAPQSVPDKFKQNCWLQRHFSKSDRSPYILFCPGASTPLRAIPDVWHRRIITGLQERYALPVLGFSPITLPGYQNISQQVTTTDAYINVIRQADFVYTADSSALHIAAGFAIPTHAIFTSIDPALRVRYYPQVTWSLPGSIEPDGAHASADSQRLAQLHQHYADFYQRGIM
ncbi:glycosyltransferase family protein [Pseudocitrobacter cyperus]|uniref:ADP-heptose--LPS heptosyltransferase n=1 Tax=Pseudocitrobacter cyperus TaxID=3112843 RepID=A0ABV0HED9_9ENTR